MSQSMSFTSNSVGGEYNHFLTVNEMPKHNHLTVKGNDDGDTPNITDAFITYQSESSVPKTPGSYYSAHTRDEGGNVKHNNVQPYITVAFWKRVK